jgi:hypothetical protein
MKRLSLLFLVPFFALPARAEAPRRLVLVVSGGFGGCGNHASYVKAMAEKVRGIVGRSSCRKVPVTWVLTCFEGELPPLKEALGNFFRWEKAESFVRPYLDRSPENFHYQVSQEGKASRGTVHDGSPAAFQAHFRESFVRRALDPLAEDGTVFAFFGHSHGGWAVLESAASLSPKARVEGLYAIDAISRVECDRYGLTADVAKAVRSASRRVYDLPLAERFDAAIGILGLEALRMGRTSACARAPGDSAMVGRLGVNYGVISRRLRERDVTALNVYHDGYALHAAAIRREGFLDVNYSRYAEFARPRHLDEQNADAALSAVAHRRLADSPRVWRQIDAMFAAKLETLCQ